jgi:hypothetical protein
MPIIKLISGKKIIAGLVHPLFVSIFLGTVLLLILDPYQTRYKTEIERIEPRTSNRINYADLNNDGEQDRMDISNEVAKNATLVVQSPDSRTEKAGGYISAFPKQYVLDQWNFRGLFCLDEVQPFAGDYDQNQLLELICFTLDSNRIILNIVEPYGSHPHKVQDLVVDTIGLSYHNGTLSVADCQLYDLDGDNYKEVVFSLCAGLAPQPRNLYSFNIEKNFITKSPYSGSFLRKLVIMDLDQDGKPEITGESYAANNYPDGGIPFPDTTAWVFVYDEKLSFKVPPTPIGRCYSHLWPILRSSPQGSDLFFFHCGDPNRQIINELFSVDDQFQIEKRAIFQAPTVGSLITYSANKSKTIISDPSLRDIYSIDGDQLKKWKGRYHASEWLKIKNSSSNDFDVQFAYRDARHDDQIVFLNMDGKVLSKFNHQIETAPLEIVYAGEDGMVKRFVLMDSAKFYFFIQYLNPWRYLRFVLLLGLCGGIYAFITGIRMVQARQIARREATRKEILQLQLKSVRSQLDPHFTFNALNALSSLSMEGNHQGVDHFIGHFSRLLRTHLNTFDQVMVPLREEIEFVVSFTELQRIRFDNFFRLELEIDTDVNLNRDIPKMLIQTHVENAIKHGLRPLFEKMKAGTPDDPAVTPVRNTSADTPDGKGRVWVRIRETGTSMQIVIEDNGCGSGNSTISAFESTGTGLKAIDRIISSVRELYRMDIRQTIENSSQVANGNSGTRIIIEILD